MGWLKRIWTAPFFVGLVIGFAACYRPEVALSSRPQPAPTRPTPWARPTETPCAGALDVFTDPAGAEVMLDGQPLGVSPLHCEAPPGRHILRVARQGFEPIEQEIELCGPLQISASLRDVSPPEVILDPVPETVRPADGLKISATAQDNARILGLKLYIDEALVQQVDEDFLLYSVDTQSLARGPHRVIAEAWDEAGHVGRAQATFLIVEPASTEAAHLPMSASPLPNPLAPERERTVPAVSTASPVPSATPMEHRTPPSARSVQAYWTQTTIDTYAYREALYTDPEHAGHPYPLLHRDLVGSPRPQTYDILLVSNEYLELTFLPALGGRLYQCRFLPTGQPLFYNNAVIKPTHWGPVEQGWWLAVGGMEFALPVEEHGYVSAEPWRAEVTYGNDGSATVTLSFDEHSRTIHAIVAITLRPGRAAFEIVSTLTNVGSVEQHVQYWINAMLSPGTHSVSPALRFYFPADQVILHSSSDATLPAPGEALNWPIHAGRDLSVRENWPDWLGFFAPALRQPYTAVYDPTTELGMVRTFASGAMAGHKLFGFGPNFHDMVAYTDDDSQYIEMWAGLTPTFWEDAVLLPGQTATWQETWYPISGCGGASSAEEKGTLYATWSTGGVEIGACATRSAHWTIVIRQGESEYFRESFLIRPGAPYRTTISPDGWNSSEPIDVQILDVSGNPILFHTVQPPARSRGR
ncbi:MAG: DUF5107 domain-containing protein [Chloroflexi bacterium]|nr:DUF5107 domain-containing protein [Chloroflexota bacterium]